MTFLPVILMAVLYNINVFTLFGNARQVLTSENIYQTLVLRLVRVFLFGIGFVFLILDHGQMLIPNSPRWGKGTIIPLIMVGVYVLLALIDLYAEFRHARLALKILNFNYDLVQKIILNALKTVAPGFTTAPDLRKNIYAFDGGQIVTRRLYDGRVADIFFSGDREDLLYDARHMILGDVLKHADYARPHFRYSLRTLMCFALMAGGVYNLAWNWSNWDRVAKWQAQPSGTPALVFSGDGKSILTGGLDGSARLWNASTGALEKEFPGHTGVVHAVAVSANGTQIATAGEDHFVLLLEAQTGIVIQKLEHSAPVTSVAFSKVGNSAFATGCSDGSVHLWNLSSREEVTQFGGHNNVVMEVELKEDWRKMVIFSIEAEGKRLAHDCKTGKLYSTDTIRPYLNCRFSPDETQSLSTVDGTHVLLKTNDGAVLRTFDSAARGEFSPDSQQPSPDALQIATTFSDGTVTVWSRERPKQAWGFLVLPQFWLAGVLAGLFLWSKRKDTKTLALPEAPPPFPLLGERAGAGAPARGEGEA